VSRIELLEQILEARFDLDYAPRELKAECQRRLFSLVDKAIHGKNVSRYELLHSLHDRYVQYKRVRRKREKLSMSQRLRSQ